MTDDYLELFQQLQSVNMNPVGLFAMMFLCVGRLFPIIALAPFFGARVLPHPVKVCFGLCLFAMLLPNLMVHTTKALHFDINLIFLMLKEMMIGTIMGMLVNMPFWAAQVAGMFTDNQRGGASLMIQDPSIQSQSSPLGALYNFVLIYLFYVANGPFIYLNAMFYSYEVIPIDQFMSPAFFTETAPVWQAVLELFTKSLILGVQLASPALLIVLMTDMFLGIINRMAPQVMITFLGMPLKSLLALLVVALGWELLVSQMVTESIIWTQKLHEVIHSFNIGLPAKP